jgi:hypothetical protein
MDRFLLTAVACCLSASCAGATIRPNLTTSRPKRDALLVLPGFGYSRAGEHALQSLAPSLAADGIDLYVPRYVARSGLTQSRNRLRELIVRNHLAGYDRVHVFAFLAGAWTFNPLAATGALPNLSTVVYDRSPYQERAPWIALDDFRLLAWMKYGPVVFDVARTPYAPLAAPGVRVGLVIETEPTRFIRRFAERARRYGPYDFACDAFAQRYDDCLHVAMSHDELYTRFPEVWPELRAFILGGRFRESADRITHMAAGPETGR